MECAAVCLLEWFKGVETRTFQRDFQTRCQLSVRSLEMALQVRLKQFIENVAAFVYASPEVTAESFTRFASRSSFSSSIIYTLSMCPIITADQVPLYNSLYRKPMYNNDTSIIANDKILCPLALIYPVSASNLSIVGLNLLSSPPRRAVITETNRTRKWAITPPLKLVDVEKLGLIGYLVVRDRPAATKSTPFTQWFVTMAMLLDDLFTATLDITRGVPARTEAALRIVYPATQQEVLYYGPNSTAGLVRRDRYVLPLHATSEAPWTAECTPTRAYRARFHTVWPWVLLGVVLTSFALMAELARRGLRRVIVSRQTLHRLRVQERLLGTLQEYSKAITQAIPDAMLLLDSHGRIIGVNDVTIAISGYSMAELNQMHVSALLTVNEGEREPLPVLEPSAATSTTAATYTSSSSSTPSRPATTPSRSRGSSHDTPSTLPLDPGTCEGTVRRSDGSTLPVQASISIVDASEIDDRPLASVLSASVEEGSLSPDPAARHSLGDDDFAQIVLFHDISDQVEHVRVAAALERRATEAARARYRLLEFIVGSVSDLARDAVGDLAEFDAALAACGHPGELAGAGEAAHHMKAVLDDVAGFVGIPIAPAADGPPAHTMASAVQQPLEVVLRRVIDDALGEQRRARDAKQLAVLTDVQLQSVGPPLCVAAARYLSSDAGAPLRAVLAKTVAVGAAVSLPRARWLVLTTVTADPTSPAAISTGPRSRPRQVSRATRLDVKLAVTISRVAPDCLACESPGLLEVPLGSGGEQFGGVELTHAALVQMVARLGGTVERELARGTHVGGSEITITVSVPVVVRVDDR
ncbi:hypothetical protein H9P43_003012 [Blastocladiella emersonii ATCC 22665]|nr:hypothetical protein H9P43_003012 [Blastocladiella emersonii ATCC 22665]